TVSEPIMLTSEEALNLFEATLEEAPVAVNDQFDKIYQHVKKHLFRNGTTDEKEKSRLEAVDKLKVWKKNKTLPQDYLEDLLRIIQNDGLTGEEIRFINKLTPKNVSHLLERIPEEYLNRVVNKMNKVEEGDETLILAEQFN
ncbi:helicase domain-containing protein, partial [human gut metagenome]